MPRDEMINDRRGLGWRELALIVAMSVNIGALVWGAAVMHTTLNKLEVSVNKFVDHADQTHTNYDLRIRIIETDLAVVKTQVNLLKASQP